ncbi:hypothetical protein F5Y06DRAFT_308718 [Hypoxylon sp. FL0890]|nr:hypothetical protein F5Y06DRAFT_308718 [Hypoxylon sp. FL0890]
MSGHNQGRHTSQPPLPDISVNYDHLAALFVQQQGNIENSIRSVVRDEHKTLIDALVAWKQQQDEHESTNPPADYATSHERIEHLQTIEGSNRQIHSLRQQLSMKKSELAQEKQKAGKLRSMLVKESPTYIIDADAMSKVTALRSLVFRFVKSTYDTTSLDPSQPLMHWRQAQVFSPFRHAAWPKKYLTNRACSLVFDILWDIIFSRSFYNPGGEPHLDDLHSSLQYVEETWRNWLPKENLKEFVDWRAASIKCASLFDSSGEKITEQAAQTIWDALRPMTVKPDAEQKGKTLLLGLCADALRLSLDLRNSRDVFEIRSIQGPLAANLDSAEEYAEEEIGEHTKHTAKQEDIAFCIFGALVKRTEEDPLKDIVLVKAPVVVYRGGVAAQQQKRSRKCAIL